MTATESENAAPARSVDKQIAKNRDHYALLRKLALILPDRWFLALRYRLRFGKWPNLDNPALFNERLLNMLLTREQGALRSRVADKLAMRDYVTEVVGPRYLTKIYGRGDNFDALDWEALPERFVLKSNHSSRQFVFVDKATADKDRLRLECDGWLTQNYYHVSREYVYKDIKPQLYAEEVLVASDGGLPNDIKVHVFHGRARFIRINENKLGEGYREVFYDRNWKRLPFLTASYEPDQEEIRTGNAYEWAPPKHLADMIDLSEKLGAPFSFIRVDFCDLGDRFVITELTNFPAAANDDYRPRSIEAELGRLLVPRGELSDREAEDLDRLFP